MLNKKHVDKRLKKYIREHLGKGYSKKAVKHVLVSHGYDEPYVDGLLRKHSELQFVKIYAIFASVLLVFSVFAFNLTPITQPITGYAVSSNEGCCTSICQQTSKEECYGKFAEGKKCDELNDCKVGCCIDKEKYCLTNYLHGNCINGYGTYFNKDCSEIFSCRGMTNKSYSQGSNANGKNKQGIPAFKPFADYYKSLFNIKYYLYDKTDVISVKAELMENGTLVDSIALYDDGFHNDNAKNDNIYGNNWDSSRIKGFEGFKKLDIEVVVKYADGTEQPMGKAGSIAVLSSNKCLPIYNEWDSSREYGIVLAAQNYNENGYEKFDADVQGFLDALFSTGRFSENKDYFNVYRMEQSLSYFNIPTLASIVSSSCPSYSSKNYLIIVLDASEDYCSEESKNIVIVNPNALFYKNMTNSGINNTFADFCSYALTPKKLADSIIGFMTPPKITLHTPYNMTYNASPLNISFSVSASNYPVNSSVFMGDNLVSSETILGEEDIHAILNLTNGSNPVLILASDKNNNYAFAQLSLNLTQ